MNVPSALGGFAIGVKFGFVLLLCALVSLPREKLDSLRTNLGEFLPIGMSERIVAPESTYKREHGSVARLGAAKPLAGDWNPNQKSEKREVKYPRKDLTPKPKKTVAKKKGEEKKSSEKEEKDEKVKHSTSSSSSSLSLKKQRSSKKDSEGEEKGKRQSEDEGDAKNHHVN